MSESPIRVLIVDDARFMRMMLHDLLSKSGLDVVGQAADGREALEVYRTTRPDVVTLDIMMPHTDGLHALRDIMAEDPMARVVVVSAVEHNESVAKALAIGAVDYVLKPFSPHRIVDVLRRAVQGEDSGGVDLDEEPD